MESEISIIDWFNANNIDHLRAYKRFKTNGCWDEGFLPKNVKLTWLWQNRLSIKITDAHMKMIIGKNDDT